MEVANDVRRRAGLWDGTAAPGAYAVFEMRYGSWSIVGANAGVSGRASENQPRETCIFFYFSAREHDTAHDPICGELHNAESALKSFIGHFWPHPPSPRPLQSRDLSPCAESGSGRSNQASRARLGADLPLPSSGGRRREA
jgi:hypothetical protein